MARTGMDAGLLALVQSQTGPVREHSRTERGYMSDYTGVVESAGGRVFVKAVRASGRLVSSLEREEKINPFVREFSPAVLWAARDDDWYALGFEYVAGRHASFKPGSPDLPGVVGVLDRITRIAPLPELVLDWHETRYDRYAPEGTADLFRGSCLLHGDVNPDNFLVTASGEVTVVDWSWPTRGDDAIDFGCLVVQMIAAGWSADDAERLLDESDCTAWEIAEPETLDAFAVACVNMYRRFEEIDPAPWRKSMTAAAEAWAEHRGA